MHTTAEDKNHTNNAAAVSLVTRWRGIRGVTATSDDAPTFTRLLDRYGQAALEEVLSQLELGGLYGIHRPLPYLIGSLRRWEHGRRQQDLENQRTAAAVTDTQEQLTTEDARKRQISLSPKAQYQLMAELWRMAMAMTQQRVSVDDKGRILTARADDERHRMDTQAVNFCSTDAMTRQR